MDIDQILKELTIVEKAALCSGSGSWTTESVDRVGVPMVMMTDGPHGVRKVSSSNTEMSLTDTERATCFPSAVGLAATWNRDLLRDVGVALGREARAAGVSILLGPGANIKRHPLCGRNFEYFSEDPFLSGEMARYHILGMADAGVGASLKHFVANNQESRRMTIDAIVDERTLREIYLPAFETAVKDARPWTIMASYNRLNGTYCSEHPWLLTELLRDEWGFDGVVITDWGACNDRVAGIRAGQDLEMPGNGGINDERIVSAVATGELAESDLDRTVLRVLKLVKRAETTRRAHDASTTLAGDNIAAHHALARRAATEACVLLKNDTVRGDSTPLLPLAADKRIAVVGAFAEKPRFQGGGSSQINPTRKDDVREEIRRLSPGVKVEYAPGYSSRGDAPDESLISTAESIAARSDVAIVFAGLPDSFESEGFDRDHMKMPQSHVTLIERIAVVQPRTVVVLSNGSPIEMPWIDTVPAVVESYLGGQAWGGAIADILFGQTSPSGKLAETFPLRLEDTSSFFHFPGDKTQVRYGESIFVGYRGFDIRKMDVRFPFGHGLSYTIFEYSHLKVSGDGAEVSCTIANVGDRAGAEVVQLYIHDQSASVSRPEQELKGFEKVSLEPGEQRIVTFRLDHRSYAFWHPVHHGWVVEAGEFEIRVGSSSRDIHLRSAVTRTADPEIPTVYDENTMLGDALAHLEVGPYLEPIYDALLSNFGEYEPGSAEEHMFRSMVWEIPLRDVVAFSSGRLLSTAELNAIIEALNGLRSVDDLSTKAVGTSHGQ